MRVTQVGEAPKEDNGLITRTVVHLTDELLARLDTRAAGEGRTRSDLVRDAVASYLAREEDIDRQIVESYTREPQEGSALADWSARAMIAAEPWVRP